jgi:ligand-binding sensor domain-containing protein
MTAARPSTSIALRAALAVVGWAALARTATAAPTVAAVETETGEVRACLAVDGGTLVGTGGGLVSIDDAGARGAALTARDGLPGTRVERLVADGAGAWVVTDAGVAQLRRDNDHWTIVRAIPTAPARDLAIVGGTIYVATWDGGVVAIDRGAPKTLAMHGGGKAARARVAALAIVDGRLFAGTSAGVYALRAGRLDKLELGDLGEVRALRAEGARLWIGTTTGLYRRDDATVTPLGGGMVTAIGEIDGAIAVASTDGLRRVDRGRLIAVAGAPTMIAPAALDERAGRACAGGLDGLWLRAAPTAPWIASAAPARLPSNDVSAIAVDGERLWVGTFDHGLALLAHGSWTRVVAAGIDRRVNAILVEPRAGAAARVWVGTAAGLVTIDRDGAGALAVARITKRDGLPGRSVLTLGRLADGGVVAGSSSGAALIDGGQVRRVGPHGPIGNVWAVGQTADGALWLGTTTGLYRGPATAWTDKDPDGNGGWQRFAVATGALGDDWVTALAVRGDAIWAGTYRHGVFRFDGALRTTALGGGWINPGGLTWDGATLYAATMDGLLVGDGQRDRWSTLAALPGRDTTAAVRQGDTLWVATRRGLAAVR